MTKKLLLAVFAIFLAYRSVELVKILGRTDASRFNWMEILAS